MAGLAGSGWQLFKRNFGSIVGPLWLVSALLTALARSYVYLSPTSQLVVLLLVDVIVPVFVLSVAVAVVTVRLAVIEGGGTRTLSAAWSQLRPRRRLVATVALVPTAVTLLATWPPTTRLLVLLLFNGIIGPPLVMQAAALEGHSVGRAFDRARRLLKGRGARTILYLVNVVVGTGLIALLVGGALAYATIGSGPLEIVTLPVQTLFSSAVLGYVVSFEFVLFRHLSAAQADPSPD